MIGLPSGALATSSQTLYLKVKASKKVDSSCQLLPVPFVPVPTNKQHLFLLLSTVKGSLLLFLFSLLISDPHF